MSRLLESLLREHEVIEAVLVALRAFTTQPARATPDPRHMLGHFVIFFRDYLDQWHHAKEEQLLFPAMIGAGLPAGLVKSQQEEHERGRELLAGLASLCEGTGRLTLRELGSLRELSDGYSRIVAQHIAREDQVLFPMVERLLSADQRSALDARAAAVDAHWGQQGADLRELGRELCWRFGGLAGQTPAPGSG